MTDISYFRSMLEQLKREMVETVRHYNAKGWSPATSTNYSFKTSDQLDSFWVSKSGVEKSAIVQEDFIEVNLQSEPLQPGNKPSAETAIHALIYQYFPQARVILHSHGAHPVVASLQQNNSLVVTGLELQKGFEGQTTHENKLCIPVFENSQDMHVFCAEVIKRISEIEQHCFLIRGHGSYAWGSNFFSAKRHLETLDYLCEIQLKRKDYGSTEVS